MGGNWESAEFTPEREANGVRAITTAYDNGFTFFDHADIYSDGIGEVIFGKALKEVHGMRETALIATKCGIRRAGHPPQSPYRYDSSRAHIVESCEGSLRRLGVETIDLYQIHRTDFLGDPAEIAAAFSELKQSGKVREFGVSNCRPTFLAALQKHCPMPLVANQVEISLLKLDCLGDGTLDQCLAEKITPMAWSPLGGGRIANNSQVDMTDPNHSHRLRLREALDAVARDHGVARSVIAVAWLLKHPSGIIPIVGSTNPDNIKELAKADGVDLSREEWYKLMEAAHGHRLP